MCQIPGMPDSHSSRPAAGHRPKMLLAAATLGLLALGSFALVGSTVQAAPPAGTSGTLTAAPSTPPPVPTPPPAPPVVGPKGSTETKARMWAVSLSNMVVYENGSGYLFGFWRQFGETVDKPARLYWGRPSSTTPGGCPDVSDRVYQVLQAGFAQQSTFFLVVDRDPDPRQPGAYCVRGVELEARAQTSLPPVASPPPAPPPQKPPATTPPLMK